MKENNRILEATDSASIKPNPRNDEESKIEMYSKLIITIEASEHIEYDVDKLHNALLYFCYHNLKHIDPKYLPDLYIDVDTDYCREMDNCGSLNADESDILLIALSTKNIEKESGMGFYYDSPLKSLFHVFLHEAYNSSFAPLNWGKVVERIGDSVEISSKLGFGTSKLGQSV